uniref:ABC transporter substrate-binding protein n=1 Tax=Faecousia sp. TaxID=2952921 RepID=UPI0040270D0F
MKRLLLLFLAVVLLLCGCSAPQVQDFAPDEAERLVIYTSHKKDVWWPIVKEFEARTGIWVQVVQGGTNELLEQLKNEKDSPAADLMFGGGVESLEANANLFTPYHAEGSDSILPQYRSADGLWTPFSALPLVLIYNPKLLCAQDLTSWADLLKPELRGRIAFADPAVSGSSYTALVTMLEALHLDTDEGLQAFALNLEGRQLSASGDVLSAVAAGESWVGITLEETASRRIAAGEQLAMVYPADGTSCVSDGSAIVAGARHPDNARLFADFTVSRDVQSLMQEQFCRRSVRSDIVPTAALPVLDTIPQVTYDLSWASTHRDSLLMSWEFYLGSEAEK